jgi:uncharacterized protein
MRKFLTILSLTILLSCQSESGPKSGKDPGFTTLVTPKGESVNTRVVYREQDHIQGLSGVKPDDFANNDGMLFWYLEEGMRQFWMPDTYFDLDLFFLDKDLKITDIIRKLPHYVGRHNESLIPRAREVWSRHVLEMKASSNISASLHIGDQLKWKGELSLSEAEEKIFRELKKN